MKVGIQKSLFKKVEEILLSIGHFYQVQNDYKNCFGDPNTTSKIKGTDIEEGKCTWLVVSALDNWTPSQRKIIEVSNKSTKVYVLNYNFRSFDVQQKNYGSKDFESVSRIKNLYADLELPKMYFTFIKSSYELLLADISKLKHKGLSTFIFKTYLNKYSFVRPMYAEF